MIKDSSNFIEFIASYCEFNCKYKIIQGLIYLLYIYIYILSEIHFSPPYRGHQYKVFKYPIHYNARANFLPAELLAMYHVE